MPADMADRVRSKVAAASDALKDARSSVERSGVMAGGRRVAVDCVYPIDISLASITMGYTLYISREVYRGTRCRFSE